MKSFLLAVLAAAALGSGDSYLFVAHGRSITNGVPVNG